MRRTRILPEEHQHTRLDSIAKDRNCSKSEVVRGLLDQHLRDFKPSGDRKANLLAAAGIKRFPVFDDVMVPYQ